MTLSLRHIQIVILLAMVGFSAIFSGCKSGSEMAFSKGHLYNEPNIPHAQLGDNITPKAYAVDMTIDPRADHMSGLVTIDIEIAKSTQSIWIHAKNIEVSEAFAMQEDQLVALTFTPVDSVVAPSGLARLTSAQPLKSGMADLIIAYKTPYNLALNSAYKTRRDGEDYILTQFEALGAREAFPSFDEPRFKVPFDITITAPSEYKVFANTPALAISSKGAGWSQHVFARTQSLPTYLLAFGVGPWEVAEYAPVASNDIRMRPIELRGFAAKGEAKNMKYALEHTGGLLTEFERYFKSEYPYEKLDLIAAPDFAYGAMENPGAIVYREYLVLLNESSPQRQKDSYMRVHAHELAHQWFGNLVTPIWWEDIWLNEAFATWLGNKMAARYEPERRHDRETLDNSLGAMELDSLPSVRAVQEPLLRSERVIDQFDAITYRKGGGVLSMIESYLGEQAFRDGVHLYMKRHAGGVASSDDFFAALADGAGQDEIVPALKSFVDQPGLPLISVSANNSGTLTLVQSRYEPLGADIAQDQSWTIPFCLRTGYAGAGDKDCFLMSEKTQTYMISQNAQTQRSEVFWIMPNADGAGYYRFALSPSLWRNLLEYIDELTDREKRVVLDSLVAGFKTGDIDPTIFLEGISLFVSLADHETAQSAGDVLYTMTKLVNDDVLPDLARFTRTLYGEKYRQLMRDKDDAASSYAAVMAERLVMLGQDQALIRKFTQQGSDYLGLDGSANKTDIDLGFLKLALSSVMEHRGPKALDPLLKLAQSGNAYEKSQAVAALGHVKDRATGQILLEKIGPGQTVLTGRQSSAVLSSLMDNPHMKPMAWAWLKENFDFFLDEKVADSRKATISGIFEGCSREERDDAGQFFESKAALIPGYERRLAQTLQRIDLCAALKEEMGQSLSAALKARL